MASDYPLSAVYLKNVSTDVLAQKERELQALKKMPSPKFEGSPSFSYFDPTNSKVDLAYEGKSEEQRRAAKVSVEQRLQELSLERRQVEEQQAMLLARRRAQSSAGMQSDGTLVAGIPGTSKLFNPLLDPLAMELTKLSALLRAGASMRMLAVVEAEKSSAEKAAEECSVQLMISEDLASLHWRLLDGSLTGGQSFSVPVASLGAIFVNPKDTREFRVHCSEGVHAESTSDWASTASRLSSKFKPPSQVLVFRAQSEQQSEDWCMGLALFHSLRKITLV